MQGRGLLPDVAFWTPESELFPFFRLQETTISMPWLAPEGKTVISADIGCQVGDELWNMSDEELGELCVKHLEPIIADARQRYLGCHVLRTPIAYPVLLSSYETQRKRLRQDTGIDGLYSVGRNGEFDHIMMEDGYHHVRDTAREIAKRLAA
jgi:protoporphyrinogen oxidase